MDEASTLYAVLGPGGRVITTGHHWRLVIRDRSLASLRPGRGRRPRDLPFVARTGAPPDSGVAGSANMHP